MPLYIIIVVNSVKNGTGDNNCGIYAMCHALNNWDNNITTVPNILEILGLKKLPNY